MELCFKIIQLKHQKSNDSINNRDVKVKTLQESRLGNDAVRSSDIDSLFHLRRSEIASDTITSSHLGDKTIQTISFY